MNQDPIIKTKSTYDQIATDYAERWQDRGSVSEAIARYVELVPVGGVVCDVGCGPGFDTDILHQHGFKAVGFDLSWRMMQAGKNEHGINQPFVQVDMRQLPLGKTAVDGLWANASLLHLPRKEVALALQNFARVLKPEGILYLSVKMGDDAKWIKNPFKGDLSRFYIYWQSETLDPLLVQSGFKIIDGWENQGSQDRWLVRFAQR